MPMLITTATAADESGYTQQTIRNWCAKYEGSLAIRIGNQWRIRKEAFERIMNGDGFADLIPRTT
jgi:hypothetical protein